MRDLARSFCVFVLLLGLAPGGTHAREVAGVRLPETVRLSEAGPTLRLNGAGIRRKFFFKIYVGGLYLAHPAHTVAEVLAQAGPRRVTMHIVYDEVSAEKLVDGWNEGFEKNLDRDRRAALTGAIERFNALFRSLKAGETVDLDYLPDHGTRVSFNGKVQGMIPGKAFNDALLLIWLGERPASRGLKKAMLGG